MITKWFNCGVYRISLEDETRVYNHVFVSPISLFLNNAAWHVKSSSKEISSVSTSVEQEDDKLASASMKSGTYPRKYKENESSLDT